MDESRALRVYRLFLHLFPRRFRKENGRDLERLFLDMRRERRAEGRGFGPGFWLPLAWDTVSHALRERFSGHTPLHEATKGPTMTTMLGDLWNDLRYAVRGLIRQPMYGGMVVLMMTLGIAGNAAVFRIFNGLFLRPLPFQNSERLVDLDVRAPRWNLEHVGMAYADFVVWRDGNRTFDAMGVLDEGGANYSGPDGAVRVTAVTASYDLPEVLGLEPVLGRFFTREEDVPDGPRVVLVSYDFWQQHFGGARDVLGQTATLDGQPYEIIGVLPREASFVSEAEVWSPLQDDATNHDSFYLQGVGRMKPGVTVKEAVADLTRVHKAQVDRWSVNEITFPIVESLRNRYLGETRLGAEVLLGAVAIVLLIACANIAGLMLARSLGRTREMGIRRAMGAGRVRIVRQLLTESLALAAVGAGVGAWIGVRGSGAMVDRLSDQLPRWVTFDLDWRFLAFTIAVTVGAAVVFGLAPALQTSSVDPTEALNASSGRTTASGRRRRAMGALVAGEVALALILLVVGGLFVRDLQRLQNVDPGFRTEGVLSYRMVLPDARYKDSAARLAFWNQHLDDVRSLPGVQSAAATTVLPLAGHSGWFFSVKDAPPRGEDEANPVVLNRAVSPGYLGTMGVELLAGRTFTDFDGRDENTKVAIVNQTFVKDFLAHRKDPLGAQIKAGGDSEPWWTVVGVTRDTKHYGLDKEMRPAVYQPLRQLPLGSLTLVARTNGDPNQLVASIRRTLRDEDPQLAMFDVQSMAKRLDDSLWTRRAGSWLIAAFSTVALLLAVAGLYGVISYGVSQRVQEIGIRMALGADRGQVLGRVLRQGMTIVAVGVVLGLGGALAAARPVSGALTTGESATDPLVYGGVTVLLLGVALMANFLPARRAARLEPMGVLRGE